MTDKEKLAALNKQRNDDFTDMRGIVDKDFVDMMSMKAMDFFDIPKEKKDIVGGVVNKWAETRDKAIGGITDKMKGVMGQFGDLDDDAMFDMMEKVKTMGESKMEELLKGMQTDEM